MPFLGGGGVKRSTHFIGGVIVTFLVFFSWGGVGTLVPFCMEGGGLFFNEGGVKNCNPRPPYLCVDSGNLALILRNFPSVGSYYLRSVKPWSYFDWGHQTLAIFDALPNTGNKKKAISYLLKDFYYHIDETTRSKLAINNFN